ncbi:MAG: hypothetical protein K2H16_07050 [Prevotella sp.]|nr:hypothetical protein [Prevotella sp.]MDE6150940.1 hypothetical protein [Prevotella sp.]
MIDRIAEIAGIVEIVSIASIVAITAIQRPPDRKTAKPHNLITDFFSEKDEKCALCQKNVLTLQKFSGYSIHLDIQTILNPNV